MITKTEEGVPSTDEFVADMRAAGAQLQVGAALGGRKVKMRVTRPEAWVATPLPVESRGRHLCSRGAAARGCCLGRQHVCSRGAAAGGCCLGRQTCAQQGCSCRWVLKRYGTSSKMRG